MANISNSTDDTLIDGSTGADFIENTYGDRVTIFAYKGDDTISNKGNSTSVYIDAGKGNDSIYVSISSYSDGRQTIYGGEGDDTITFSHHTNSADYYGYSSIDGGAGNDVIRIVQGNRNTVTGGDGNDTISANSNSNRINAGAGDDFITVSSSQNTVDAGEGNDTIYSSASNNSINGGDGDDYIALEANATLNTVNAGAGNDTINLQSMSNLIQYSGGVDIINGFNMTDTGYQRVLHRGRQRDYQRERRRQNHNPGRRRETPQHKNWQRRAHDDGNCGGGRRYRQ